MKFGTLQKMLLLILLPTILGIGLLAFTAQYLGSSAMRKNMDAQIYLNLKTQVAEVENLLILYTNIISEDSNRIKVREFIIDNALNKDLSVNPAFINNEQQDQDMKKYLDTQVRKFELFEGVGITDKDGIIIAHSDNKGFDIPVDIVRSYPSIVSALKGNTATEIRELRLNKRNGIIIASPVFDTSNNVIGSIFGIIALEHVNKDHLSQIKIGNNSYYAIVDHTGKILSHPNQELINKKSEQYELMEKVMAKRDGIIDYKDRNNIERIAYITPLEFFNWIIFFSPSYEELMAETNMMVRNIILAGITVVIIIGSIIFLMAHNIAKNLRVGANFAKYISEGNLEITESMQKEITRVSQNRGEIGLLARSMTNMIKYLLELINKTKESEEKAMNTIAELEKIIQTIATSSTQLSTQINQSTICSTSQATKLAEVSTAMDEMNFTVTNIAENASKTSINAESTREKAMEGEKITLQCRQAMDQVRHASLTLKDNMALLVNHTKSISSIMSVISDIADQTNLLALNAAIEAARAGEAGRGFAVVADEVRKLAEKTIKSTMDVSNAISAIQSSTNDNSEQVDHTVEAIEVASQLVERSEKALQEILSLADESADGIHNIATASEEQSQTSDNILNNVSNVHTIATEMSTAMKESTNAIENLANQAIELAKIAENLKKH